MVDAHDPRLRPIPPSTFKWKALPRSRDQEDVVQVCMIPSSQLEGPANMFVANLEDRKSRMQVPSFSFLIQHKSGKTLLWDLGLTRVSSIISLLALLIVPSLGCALPSAVRLFATEYGTCSTELLSLLSGHFKREYRRFFR